MPKEKIKIYTDGAARGNPGKAGWGAVILKCEPPDYGEGPEILRKASKSAKCAVLVELGGRSEHATNNQMELSAAIGALGYLKKKKNTLPVEIYADSKYVILGVTEWIPNWIKNGWRTTAKKPVLNRELWQELHKLTEEFKPGWLYVEGHSGDRYNERADEIATSFADGLQAEIGIKAG
jgi:ribonuclease HI